MRSSRLPPVVLSVLLVASAALGLSLGFCPQSLEAQPADDRLLGDK